MSPRWRVFREQARATWYLYRTSLPSLFVAAGYRSVGKRVVVVKEVTFTTSYEDGQERTHIIRGEFRDVRNEVWRVIRDEAVIPAPDSEGEVP